MDAECSYEGTCVAVPSSCPMTGSPRCGCDGEVYMNACVAQRAEVSIGNTEACELPDGKFGCGAEFCNVRTQYCEYHLGGGSPDSARCLALTCTGDATACDCLDPSAPCPDPEYIGFHECWLKDGGASLTCVYI